jgi:hypothetical protein
MIPILVPTPRSGAVRIGQNIVRDGHSTAKTNGMHGASRVVRTARRSVEGASGCTGRSRGGRVFALCGERLIFFNGYTALVVNLALRSVEAREHPGVE